MRKEAQRLRKKLHRMSVVYSVYELLCRGDWKYRFVYGSLLIPGAVGYSQIDEMTKQFVGKYSNEK